MPPSLAAHCLRSRPRPHRALTRRLVFHERVLATMVDLVRSGLFRWEPWWRV